ncbi:hypothetical protein ACLB1Q_23160 [Escherichia coli]
MWLEPDEWQGNAGTGRYQVLSAHPAHRTQPAELQFSARIVRGSKP